MRPFFAAGTEVGKFRLFGILLPLYTKIAKDEVLDKYARGKLHGYILANPGCHYSMIKQDLGLRNGTLTYHLTVLERNGLVVSERDGLLKRFYPRDFKIPRGKFYPKPVQETMLNIIGLRPGLSQSELARALDLKRQIVNYHARLLRQAGLVEARQDGKITRLYKK